MPNAHPERVAVVSHSHPSLSKGGAEIAAYTLFRGLEAIGVRSSFIAACADADRSRISLGSSRERAVFYDPRRYDHLYHLAMPSVEAQLRGIVEKDGAEVVNFHHFLHLGLGSVNSLAREPHLRTVLTLHEFLPICHHHGQMITRPNRTLCSQASPNRCGTCFPELTQQQLALRRRMFLDSFAPVAGFVSPSRFLADRFVAWGLPADGISIIENGLAHRDPIRPRPARAPFTFGFFGQINPFKGVDTLLRAVELIGRKRDWAQKIRVRIHGNLVGQSDEFAARLGAAVERHEFLSFAGPYDNATVGALMAECDYVTVPSSWWENSPVVIQEAFAAGCPVLCTGIGGMAEKVRDGISGLHLRPGDHVDLAEAMVRAADAETLQRLRSGLPYAIDGAEMARRYMAVFAGRSGKTEPAPRRPCFAVR